MNFNVWTPYLMRSLQIVSSPEIVTFDELFERAKFIVHHSKTGSDTSQLAAFLAVKRYLAACRGEHSFSIIHEKNRFYRHSIHSAHTEFYAAGIYRGPYPTLRKVTSPCGRPNILGGECYQEESRE